MITVIFNVLIRALPKNPKLDLLIRSPAKDAHDEETIQAQKMTLEKQEGHFKIKNDEESLVDGLTYQIHCLLIVCKFLK